MARRIHRHVLAVALLLAGCAAPAPTGRLQGVVVEDPTPKPSFVLTDTAGERYDFAARTDGRLTLLFFGYTSCPDICPVQLSQIAEVLQQMPDVAARTEVVFVGVDWERDTPERIRSYLDRIDPRFVGLTGTPEELRAAQEAAGVPPAFIEDGTVAHASWVIAYAPDGLNHAIYPFGTRQATWRNDLPILAAMGEEGRR